MESRDLAGIMDQVLSEPSLLHLATTTLSYSAV